MKIFIDFDDVILNTGKFSANLRSFFQLNGISEELFKKHYYTTGNEDGIKLFDPWAMFDRLETEEGLDMKLMREMFKMHIEDLSHFVFDDVKTFLERIGRENIYLVSFGLPIFQNEKIVACGINKLVSGCVVTKRSKADAIEQIIAQVNIDPEEEIIFIDDRVEQVQDIKKRFPKSHTFLLCRKEGRYCDLKNEFCDYEIHDLRQAHEIIIEIQENEKN